MDINSRAVLEVYSDMSVAAAAKRLGTSESYLKNKIMAAEMTIGNRIFKSLDGTLELTEEGKRHIDWLNYLKSFQINSVDSNCAYPDQYKMGAEW
ncbi:MAG: LysR family transcriptional regulator [Firmicutes bacterium]|nr:LysR family transcriptional regulator [Bacillota bacterium]MBQ4371219.1 LysR family transcriptional regulator [Bacillota bacterium]